MKFLADENIEKSIVDDLRKLGYDIKWVPEVDRHLDDMAVLKLATKEGRILLTNDKDFGEIVFRQKAVAAGIILFRVKGQDAKGKVKSLNKLLSFYKDKIPRHFVVMTIDKMRFIPI